MTMDMPTEAVDLLNALYWQSPEVEARLTAFSALRDRVRHWLAIEGAFAMCDKEAGLLDNLRYLWNDIDRATRARNHAAMLEWLSTLLPQALALQHRIACERAQAAAAADPLSNDLVLAAMAVMSGDAQGDVVTARLERWKRHVASIEALLELLSPCVSSAMRLSAATGLIALRQGTARLERALPAGSAATEALAIPEIERAVAEIRFGADELAEFLDWQQGWQRETAERHARFAAVPLHAGSELDELLHRARELPREGWAFGVKRARRLIDRLTRHWTDSASRRLLASDAGAAAVAGVDAALVELRAAAERLLDRQRPVDTVLTAAEAALRRVSDAFQCVAECQGRGAAELAPGFAADVCDGVSAVLRGARPDVSLRALVAVTPPPAFTEAHDRLAAYLECGETGLLLEAVEAVRAALRDDDALASSDEDAAALATPRLSLCA